MKFEELLDFPEKDDVIFDSKNICAVFSPADVKTQDTLVVTFYPFLPPEQKKQPITGFSRESFRKLGYDTIHIIPSGNHWYQYDDLEQMLEEISIRKSGYKRLAVFGQSMGAYGALQCSKALNADRVVAICAQFTTDASKVDFDPGWQHYINTGGVKFIRDNFHENVSLDAEVILAYDPFFSPDILHANEIKKHINVIPLVMPFTEHAVARHLALAGLMPSSLDILVSGDEEDIQGLRRTFRKARKSSSYFTDNVFYAIVNRLKKQKKFDAATKMVRQKLQETNSPVIAKAYYEISEEQKDYEETARRLLEVIGRFGDETPLSLYKKCIQMMRVSKDFLGCESLVARLMKKYPNDIGLHREYAEAAHHQKKWAESKKRWLHFRSLLKERTPALVYFRLAQAEDNLGNLESAVDLIEEGLSFYKDDPGMNAWRLKHEKEFARREPQL